MTKPFKSLRNQMPKSAQTQAAQKTSRMLKAVMALQDLRQSMELSQQNIALRLNTKQANISRLERRSDMYISTLRDYIEAMGGQLDIIAKFPEGDVRIDQFKDSNAD